MDVVVLSHLIAQPAYVDIRMLSDSSCCGFYYHIVKGDFNRGNLIDTLTSLHSFIHVDLHGKVEVRSSKLTFGQPAGNGFAHLRNRDLFKAFFAYHLRKYDRSGGSGSFGGNPPDSYRSDRGWLIVFHVAARHSSILAGALNFGNVITQVFRHF